MADVVIVDAQTGEVTARDFTPEEAAQRALDQQAEAARKAITDALDGNRATLTERAAAALQGNRDFLALPTVTNEDVVRQVKLLTQECSAIIRLLTNALDATD